MTRIALLFLSVLLCLNAAAASDQPHGYALLYSVTSQDQDVDKLLWVKHPGEEIANWIKEIAAFNGDVTKQLEAWKKDGSAANLKDTGLPPVEQQARDRDASRTSGELLWDSGVDLRIELILSQLSSLGYCADLCYAMGKTDYGKAHKNSLESWRKRFLDLNKQGIQILASGDYLTEAKEEPPHHLMR